MNTATSASIAIISETVNSGCNETSSKPFHGTREHHCDSGIFAADAADVWQTVTILPLSDPFAPSDGTAITSGRGHWGMSAANADLMLQKMPTTTAARLT